MSSRPVTAHEALANAHDAHMVVHQAGPVIITEEEAHTIRAHFHGQDEYPNQADLPLRTRPDMPISLAQATDIKNCIVRRGISDSVKRAIYPQSLTKAYELTVSIQEALSQYQGAVPTISKIESAISATFIKIRMLYGGQETEEKLTAQETVLYETGMTTAVNIVQMVLNTKLRLKAPAWVSVEPFHVYVPGANDASEMPTA